MLSPKMLQALNDQINAEYHSSYLYLSMAAWCESISLKGFANWFRVQTQEEMVHVMKFFDFVNARRGEVELKPIDAVKTKWATPLEAFEDTLKHEQYITGRINKLVALAKDENDPATHAFLQWFVTEQVEEEATADELIQQLKLVASAPGGLFLLDRELAKRTFAPPAAADAAAT